MLKPKRTIKACTTCRLTKTKCRGDGPPCSGCVQRGRGETCVYKPLVRSKQDRERARRAKGLGRGNLAPPTGGISLNSSASVISMPKSPSPRPSSSPGISSRTHSPSYSGIVKARSQSGSPTSEASGISYPPGSGKRRRRTVVNAPSEDLLNYIRNLDNGEGSSTYYTGPTYGLPPSTSVVPNTGDIGIPSQPLYWQSPDENGSSFGWDTSLPRVGDPTLHVYGPYGGPLASMPSDPSSHDQVGDPIFEPYHMVSTAASPTSALEIQRCPAGLSSGQDYQRPTMDYLPPPQMPHMNTNSHIQPPFGSVSGLPSPSQGNGSQNGPGMVHHSENSHNTFNYSNLQCPFCPYQEYQFLDTNSLKRHVSDNHPWNIDDPILHDILARCHPDQSHEYGPVEQLTESVNSFSSYPFDFAHYENPFSFY